MIVMKNQKNKEVNKIDDLKPNYRGRLHEIFCNINHKMYQNECGLTVSIDEAMSLISKAQQQAREEIQEDLQSVMGMLEGKIKHSMIANYIKEYLVKERKNNG